MHVETLKDFLSYISLIGGLCLLCYCTTIVYCTLVISLIIVHCNYVNTYTHTKEHIAHTHKWKPIECIVEAVEHVATHTVLWF